MLSLMNVPEPTKKYSFENLLLQPSQEKQLRFALSNLSNLLIIGEKETGKTHLLNAIVNHQIEEKKTALLLDCQMHDSEHIFDAVYLPEFIAVDNINKWLETKGNDEKVCQLVKKVETESKQIWFSMPSFFQEEDDAKDLNFNKLIANFPKLGLVPLKTKTEIASVLANHANKLNLEISNYTIKYLINHCSSNIARLVEILMFLKTKSHSHNNAVDIKFIKKYFEI